MNATARVSAVGALLVSLAFVLAACQTQGTVTSVATDAADKGPEFLLSKPEGDGPFPAVVLTHGCGGTERNTQYPTVWRGLNNHASLLRQNGYVTLIVDSFERRRITDGCQSGAKYYPLQVSDAHDALDHLASLPFVDDERIGYVGQSLGGGTALRLATRGGGGRAVRGYSAVVAYYPYCGDYFLLSEFELPALILIGSDDDWTPARLCRTIARHVPDRIELVVYPSVHHSFDLPMQGPYYVKGMGGQFHTVQGNAAARRDSQRRMITFFAKHLGPAQ